MLLEQNGDELARATPGLVESMAAGDGGELPQAGLDKFMSLLPAHQGPWLASEVRNSRGGHSRRASPRLQAKVDQGVVGLESPRGRRRARRNPDTHRRISLPYVSQGPVLDCPSRASPHATNYKGRVSHWRLGRQPVTIVVRQDTASRGRWQTLERDCEITVVKVDRRVILDDGNLRLDGNLGHGSLGGVVEGEVMLGGVRGGEFVLREVHEEECLQDRLRDHLPDEVVRDDGSEGAAAEETQTTSAPSTPRGTDLQLRPSLKRPAFDRALSCGAGSKVRFTI